jgi:hypothetical protein
LKIKGKFKEWQKVPLQRKNESIALQPKKDIIISKNRSSIEK